ncbi:deoxyribodipyrimidine photo-lyase [Ferrimonas aestuarii]|uniref:Deoxyribodipyrimidine photo-lyase n=1 Tax=Ferrimonas aestuarii TaxID=2569539 RepID=A0A4U1BS16_9GAMM|nr:deoxyribodipyrimidine photo-lyase [Ferrimonas aestuarii]TKB57376.1 deoxyribodipyrimidine photo-lyase [Ferrimonas aestuarii]
MSTDSSASSKQLVWFRKDLRVADHAPLSAACSKGPVRALYIATPGQWQTHGVGANQASFIQQAVTSLGQQLAELGIPLEVIHCHQFSDIEHRLTQYCNDHQIRQIHAHSEAEIDERRRDQHLQNQGLPLTLYGGHCILEPGTVRTQQQQVYRVFTPFKRRWLDFVDAQQLIPLPNPKPQGPALVAEAGNWCIDYPQGALPGWQASERKAHQLLQHFIHNKAESYHQDRDRPDLNATSGLSPYLALGVISPKQCLHQLLQRYPNALEPAKNGPFTWVNELIWREFYRHLLVLFPKLSMHHNFNELGDRIQWRDDQSAFEAWCQGKTGYPLVDAAMRQLTETGWMHNRLRMVTASFLTKNLLIDWRLGERFFQQHLVDWDLAANNGGWQWSASTGCDAQPYFRIFNPVTQSKNFDPLGRFIRRFIPELNHLDDKMIHNPSDECRPADYPAPIVDLKESRARALDVFSVLKKG